MAERYAAADSDVERLKRDVGHDVRVLEDMLSIVAPITPEGDAKLQKLHELMRRPNLQSGKVLIFTQYADTARYLYDNLVNEVGQEELEVIFSGDKSKARVVGRFAPRANPEFRLPSGDTELRVVVATDVLAEGLNLQDCDTVVNYDLHWNPVRLIQRFGRIDRIGAEHDRVFGFNFLPEVELDRNLGLRQFLSNRIQEVHDSIGEDAAILDRSEELNVEAMYAIYEAKSGQLDLFEDGEESDVVDLNEAEEMLRPMKREDPSEFERIAALRDGVRSSLSSKTRGTFVFLESGRYQQLLLLDQDGAVVTRDVGKVLGALRCAPDTPVGAIPQSHNALVAKAREVFAREARVRVTERDHVLGLTQGQRYVLQELRGAFAAADDDRRPQLEVLERAFRAPITGAVNRELGLLRRNDITGEGLLAVLTRIYHQHALAEGGRRPALDLEREEVPRIVCSEALT